MADAVVARREGGWLREKLTTEERYVDVSVRRRLYATSYTLIGLGTVLFVALLVQVMNGIGIVGLDHAAQTDLVRIRDPFLTTSDEVLAVVFGPVALPIIILVLTVAWVILAKHLWRPLLLAGAMTLGLILIQVITRLVRRDRPPIDLMLFGRDTTYSFPSGHVAGTADFCFVIAYLIASRKPNTVRTVVAFVVAALVVVSQVFSRLYLGYHWLSDTLASICLSMVVLGLVIAIDTRRTVRIPGEKVTGELSKVQTDET
jgi:membrane-associated phospholipid phosphatase